MKRTDRYVRQHEDILGVTEEISGYLNAGRLSGNEVEVRLLLSNLAGKINYHLAIEDELLYPELMNHQDANVKGTAKRFMDDMGGISASFEAYISRWSTAAVIRNANALFISETGRILSALTDRIRRENRELYPLAA